VGGERTSDKGCGVEIGRCLFVELNGYSCCNRFRTKQITFRYTIQLVLNLLQQEYPFNSTNKHLPISTPHPLSLVLSPPTTRTIISYKSTPTTRTIISYKSTPVVLVFAISP
jgi:hypothetical protein